MDCLVDTNVLVRTIDRLHPHYPISLNALDKILRGGGHVYIAAQNLVEFWSVCTRPLNRNGLGLSTTEAQKELTRLESIFLFLPEVPAIFPEWRRLVAAHTISGFEAFDTRLVAVMHVYGLTDLLTFNRADFVVYTGIKIIDPSTIR